MPFSTRIRTERVSNRWRVYPCYVIESGVIKKPSYSWLVEHFTEAATPYLVPGLKDYTPADCPELPQSFARLHDGNEADILKFIHQYGTLGHDRIALKQGHPEWCAGGDPIDWFRAHAKTVSLCLRLSKLLQNKDGVGIRACLKTQGTNNLLTYAVLSEWTENSWPMDVPVYPDPIDLARAIRRSLINANTQYIRCDLHGVRVRTKQKVDDEWGEGWPDNGDEASVYGFTGLIEQIYQHLKNDVRNGSRVHQCKNDRCRRYFVPRNNREEYCADSCSKNTRQRNLARRQRQKQP